MSYCDIKDITDVCTNEELVKITKSPNSTPNLDRIKIEIESAEAYINSYLNGKYVVPITNPAPIIKKICVQLTVSNLYEAYYRNSAVPNAMVWVKIDAVKLLKNIREGLMSGVLDGEASAVVFYAKPRKFPENILDLFCESRE